MVQGVWFITSATLREVFVLLLVSLGSARVKVPWKIKSSIFSVLDRLSLNKVIYWIHKRVTKRAQDKVRTFALSAPHPNWIFHEQNLIDYDCAGYVFEFGAGNHLAQNLYLSERVEKQHVCDLNYMLDLELVTTAVDALHSKGLLAHAFPVRSADDLLRYGIRYSAPADAADTGLSSGSIDACISTNTLEHIPLSSLKEIFTEVFRLLRSGGICSVKIDYSDHYSHTDPKISKLNFLKYSDEEWEAYNHTMHYQNRLRHGDYVNLFSSLGFQILVESCVRSSEPFDFTPHGNFLSVNNWDAISGNFLLAKRL